MWPVSKETYAIRLLTFEKRDSWEPLWPLVLRGEEREQMFALKSTSAWRGPSGRSCGHQQRDVATHSGPAGRSREIHNQTSWSSCSLLSCPGGGRQGSFLKQFS